MKTLIAIVVLVLIAISAVWYSTTFNKGDEFNEVNTPTENTEDLNEEDTSQEVATGTDVVVNSNIGNLKVVNFSGVLEEVNTGCFADGECYVVVGGKKVTVLMGWSQKVVGSLVGVDGFGDLENFLSEKIEVYAQDSGDGSFTLYGNESFYVKVLNGGSLNVGLGQEASFSGVSIKPLSLLEDSRCPINVNCIQAGTVRVQAEVGTDSSKYEQVFMLGEVVSIEGKNITLVQVEPYTQAGVELLAGDYRFQFKIMNK